MNGNHSCANLHDDRAAFMTHDGGKETFGISSGKRISVGVTDAAGFDL
jgi:hypothetical protein